MHFYMVDAGISEASAVFHLKLRQIEDLFFQNKATGTKLGTLIVLRFHS